MKHERHLQMLFGNRGFSLKCVTAATSGAEGDARRAGQEEGEHIQ